MSNIPIIRVPNHTWPFSEHEQARLELVYSLKTLKGGRDPTTRAVFRSLSGSKKAIYLLEMDWLSLPRLTPGRIFSASPHTTDGELSGQDLWVDIPAEGVETFTLKDAQARLESTSLYEAFNGDILLPETKVFHWFGSDGSEYWLPIIEVIRKVFVRSPEMARAIIMYDGWSELVKEFSLHGDTLEITLTNHPQRGDIFYLSLIAAKPSLFKAWSSVANHLPRTGSGVSIGLPWPFNEKISIHATAKKKGSQYWIQELLDVHDIDIPYTTVVPSHPSYVNRIYDDKRAKGTVSDLNNVSEESKNNTVTSKNMITGSTVLQKSSAKVYVHIQTNSLSGFDEIKVKPEYNDKHEKSTINDSNATSSVQPKNTGAAKEVESRLADNISAKESEGIQGTVETKTKEIKNYEPLGGNLKGFVKAINHAKKELGGEAELTWVVRERLLELPKNCGARWFLKIDNEVRRSWCMACITYKGKEYCFLEMGRGEDESKFSLSTLLLVNMDKDTNPSEWIGKMVENHGHWDIQYFKNKEIRFERLHHQYKISNAWGAYFSVSLLYP